MSSDDSINSSDNQPNDNRSNQAIGAPTTSNLVGYNTEDEELPNYDDVMGDNEEEEIRFTEYEDRDLVDQDVPNRSGDREEQPESELTSERLLETMSMNEYASAEYFDSTDQEDTRPIENQGRNSINQNASNREEINTNITSPEETENQRRIRALEDVMNFSGDFGGYILSSEEPLEEEEEEEVGVHYEVNPSIQEESEDDEEEEEYNNDPNEYQDPDWIDEEIEIDSDGFEIEEIDEMEAFMFNMGRRFKRYTKEDKKEVDRKFKELIKRQRKESKEAFNDLGFSMFEEVNRCYGDDLTQFPYLSQRLLWSKKVGANNVPKLAVSKDLIPNSRGSLVRSYSNRVYSGQFSEDGSFFYSCSQDFKVRLFSTDKENLEEVKVVRADIGQWTITDATLSKDNKWLAYSSIAPIAYLTRTDITDDIQSRLSFSNSRREEFGIWSLRFSSDGKEIVAGTSNRSIMILDIESKTVVFDQKGHRDDVNAVCFADDSSQIMFSGSDDSLIKVWDRRSMYGNDCSPAGTLVGHTAGLTFVASKGDGRYCISNSKDQSMKLWDIRKLVSVDKFDLTSHIDSVLQFDYRILSYPLNSPLTHPDDISVMTYKGHEVLSTLIRCHFSPAASTGQKYLYTGSSNGKIHIYNLDGTVAQVLDTNGAMRGNDEGIINCGLKQYNEQKQRILPQEDSDFSSPERERRNRRNESNQAPLDLIAALLGGRSSGSSRSNRSGNYSHTKKVVRDVAWHPNYPIIIASCWDSGKGRLNKHIFTTDARGNSMSHKSESRYRTRSRAKNSHNY